MLGRLLTKLREYLWYRSQPISVRWLESTRVSEDTLRDFRSKGRTQLPGWYPGAEED